MDTSANYGSTMAGETPGHKEDYTEGYNPTYAAAVTNDPVNLAPNINRGPEARRFRDLLVQFNLSRFKINQQKS